jgi:FkbM family methyltransferase
MKLDFVIEALPLVSTHHARTDPVYKMLEKFVGQIFQGNDFLENHECIIDLDQYGEINFPYHKMGTIDTLDLFGLDELIIFSFYWSNRNRYSRAADVGANLGLHSILMSKCGWSVNAYEPDPHHAKLLRENLTLNHSTRVNFHELAVSDKEGELEFVRVLGNTTGSHISGAKSAPYGDLDRFPVKVIDVESIMSEVDFIKMDVEGQEAVILLSTQSSQWSTTDMIVEIGSKENASQIFYHFQSIGVNLFSQKIGWQQVKKLDDMPVSYRDGSLFISRKKTMPWGVE